MSDKEAVTKFTYEFNGDKIEFVTSAHSTWWDLSGLYLQFLNASGYCVTAKDLADYFTEMVGD